MTKLETDSPKRGRIGGRQKGTPNKVTRDLREAVRQALEDAGGVSYLVGLAHDRPELFVTLLNKALPQETKSEVAGRLILSWQGVDD